MEIKLSWSKFFHDNVFDCHCRVGYVGDFLTDMAYNIFHPIKNLQKDF